MALNPSKSESLSSFAKKPTQSYQTHGVSMCFVNISLSSPTAKHMDFTSTGKTLHMSQQERSPLWIQSPEETSRARDSLLLCLIIHAKTYMDFALMLL